MRLLLCFAAAALCASAQNAKYMNNFKQLTSGGQNAESYWSPDGKRLIFQSTREPHACDQIYIMNADGSNQRMVSTGKGVTTCAYFLKDNKHFIYASTHEAGPACPPRPDRTRGYVWAIYAGFDLYLAKDDGAIVKKLTDTPGYDAEGTVNWKTGRIVYTSTSTGDIELWSMKSDGSDKQQLTKTTGYDGGAFYDRTGKQLLWRANHPKDEAATKRYQDLLKDNLTAPMKMEVFLAKKDGSDARQITNFGCASFAPTFTPDGKKIIFASNKHECDSRKFELYMMNPDGSGLEQVTSFGGFTSFPEFSPDGKKLAFTSSLNAKAPYEFNIFVVDWKP